MALTPTAVQLALAEWHSAAPGTSTATADRLAAQLGVSRATLYRAFRDAGQRGPDRPREARYPERGEWADTLATLMAKAPVGTIPLDLCLDAAVRDGHLPPEAALVRESEYARLIRNRGYRQTQRRTRRLVAEHPMQAVQFDASTSAHFRVLKTLDDGDRLLQLWHRPDPASGYKNKPLGEDRERLILYGQWDMCTGYRHIRPVAAQGESGLDAMEYLVTSWLGSDDPRDPWRGLPEDLWSDQGPLVKYPATRDLLDRLGVAVQVGQPYQHQRQGGIESGWRTLWHRFEAQFFLRTSGRAEKWTITLSDYTAELLEYLVESNARPSRRDPTLSRRDAWQQGVNRHGGLRPCPAQALETLATEVHRTLDTSGTFRWNNQEYEVPRFHSRRVIVRRALDGTDRCIVEIPETGERVEASPHRPLGYGEFRGTPPALPIEQAQARATEHVCTTPAYAPSAPTAGSNVVHLPPRAQPVADLPDPLSIDSTYRNLADAMFAFGEIYPGDLDPQQRLLVEQVITGAGLDRTTVRDLALQLAAVSASATQAATGTDRPRLTLV